MSRNLASALHILSNVHASIDTLRYDVSLGLGPTTDTRRDHSRQTAFRVVFPVPVI
jgi:hypothetical protein